VSQNKVTGKNNVVRAKAIRFAYVVDNIRVPGLVKKNWFDIYEKDLQDAVKNFSENSEHMDFYLMTNSGVFQAF